MHGTPLASALVLLGFALPCAAAPTVTFLSSRAQTVKSVALAANVVVNNCNDGGAGSLRQAVTDAGEGGLADLTQLSCSKISLSSELVVPHSKFSIVGPSDREVTISGSNQTRVIAHTAGGAGVLTIQRLRIADGNYVTTGVARGGCIFSSAAVHLDKATVDNCLVQSRSDHADGGGMFAEGAAQLVESKITGNRASAPSAYTAGGGVATTYGLILYRSEISNNRAEGLGTCGGACIVGNYCSIVASTIAENYSGYVVGGLGVYTPTIQIINSTISGNVASLQVGGLQVSSGGYQPIIANSTIVLNNSAKFAGVYSTAAIRLYSSIVAQNTSSTPPILEDDFATYAVTDGANNLVMSTSGTVPVKPGVIALTVPPNLGPLSSNGGTTRTHLPQLGSPVIAAGSNKFAERFDQRGRGHPRSSSPQFPDMTDMGAVQFDTIFADGDEP